MTQLINDTGFTLDDWHKGFIQWDNVAETAWTPKERFGIDVPNHIYANQILPFFPFIEIIRIAFPTSADGRGFSIAQNLRNLGYQGRLRAYGHILSDQYAMARRSGFDEVEISQEQSLRQPEEEWIFRANWQAHCYQSKLRAGS